MSATEEIRTERSSIQVWKVVFHVLWYSVVIPFLGSFSFILAKYATEMDFGIVKTVGSALVGAVAGVFFLSIMGFVVAVLLIPVVGFLSQNWVVLSHAVAISLFSLFVIPKNDDFFSESLGWLVAVLFFVTIVTVVVYQIFGISRLFRK